MEIDTKLFGALVVEVWGFSIVSQQVVKWHHKAVGSNLKGLYLLVKITYNFGDNRFVVVWRYKMVQVESNLTSTPKRPRMRSGTYLRQR